MNDENEVVFGDRSDSLTDEELNTLIGNGDWSATETMEKLRGVKTRIFMSDKNKDGKLVGSEIEAAGLENLVNQSTRERH